MAVAGFVLGFAGFGIGIVGVAGLALLMPATDAVVLVTCHGFAFTLALAVHLRREMGEARIGALVLGSVAGIPLGVWGLAALPAAILGRVVGGMLVLAVGLEAAGRYPRVPPGRGWAVAAGALGGILGGLVGTPGPPVILYAAARRWTPRELKANLQIFLALNQGLTLVGFWWAGVLGGRQAVLAVSLLLPAALGVAAGHRLSARVDPVTFRRAVFALVLLAGVTLLARG